MLHLLEIEFDQLLAHGTDRAQAHQTLDPGFDGADPALQAWGQPPLLLVAAVSKARLSVSGMSAPSAAAHPSTISECLGDRCASMREFSGKDDLPTRVIDQRQSGCLAAWIDLDAQRFNNR